MATTDPLLDPPPVQSAPVPQAQVPATDTSPNLLVAMLRRWPWLLLGIGTGIVLGLLQYMQRAPVYQSSAQLLVVKNRPEMIAGTSGDARVQYVEDYVTPQVILLKSEALLQLAEKRLDAEKPYQVPPPEGVAARIAFLKTRFDVVREKEPGTNALSNVLLLTFKAPHAGDTPKYLRAIIAAYREELSGAYVQASESQLKILEAEIKRLEKAQSDTVTKLTDADHKLHGVRDPATGMLLVQGLSQEDIVSIRQRITANRTAETGLKLREIVVAKELAEIDAVGKSRSARLAAMAKLGVSSERPSIFGDLRDPESMLAHLKFKKSELAVRLGSGHPDMISLTNQIKAVEEELEKHGPPEDELERYRRKLDNEKSGLAAQLKVLEKQITDDEDKAGQMAPLQLTIENLRQDETRDAVFLRDAKREKERITSTQSSGGYEVKDVTQPADGVQIAPVLVQSLMLGAVIGLLLGCGLGLWAELADRSFRSPADIRRHLGLSVLGHVPPIRIADPPEVKPEAKLDPVLAVFLRPRSSEAEAVRGIRTQLLFSTQNRDHQVIQITSPSAGDGKSTLAANLAISLATSNKRVVLVDCDFRKPRVHKMFALPTADIGLASVVGDQADLGAAVQSCEIENLSLLPCGPRPSNPAELLSSVKFQEVLNDLRTIYDYVILDTPPVLAVSDPAAVAPRADGVIVVFRMTASARPAAERAKEELLAVSARLLGVVVNGSAERDMGYGYGYGYRYEYQYSDSYTDKQ